MAGRRICAGYYRRYDGKVVYVVSLATDTDTGEEAVIWTTYPFADLPRYWTSSKKSFCAFVEVDGERRAKYKRLMNMKISAFRRPFSPTTFAKTTSFLKSVT